MDEKVLFALMEGWHPEVYGVKFTIPYTIEDVVAWGGKENVIQALKNRYPGYDVSMFGGYFDERGNKYAKGSFKVYMPCAILSDAETHRYHLGLHEHQISPAVFNPRYNYGGAPQLLKCRECLHVRSELDFFRITARRECVATEDLEEVSVFLLTTRDRVCVACVPRGLHVIDPKDSATFRLERFDNVGNRMVLDLKELDKQSGEHHIIQDALSRVGTRRLDGTLKRALLSKTTCFESALLSGMDCSSTPLWPPVPSTEELKSRSVDALITTGMQPLNITRSGNKEGPHKGVSTADSKRNVPNKSSSSLKGH